MIGRDTAGSTHAFVAGSTRGGRVERLDRRQRAAQHRVVGRRRERDRERAVVTLEDRVLEVSEVAADRAVTRRDLSALHELVEAGVVDDAGVLDLFGDRAGADRREPVGQRRAAATRHDREVGGDRDPSLVSTPVTIGASPFETGSATRPSTATPSQDRAVGAGEHRPPQHPFERRAPARQHHELVVTGTGRPVGHLRGQVLGHPQLGGAGGEQVGEHVGIRGAQQAVEPGQEGVAVADLRRAPAIPVEGGARIGRQGSRVAFEQRHPVPVPAQRQGRPQPGHAGAHHHDPRTVIHHGVKVLAENLSSGTGVRLQDGPHRGLLLALTT